MKEHNYWCAFQNNEPEITTLSRTRAGTWTRLVNSWVFWESDGSRRSDMSCAKREGWSVERVQLVRRER